MIIHLLTLHTWRQGNMKSLAGKCSPIFPTAWARPLRIAICLVPFKITCWTRNKKATRRYSKSCLPGCEMLKELLLHWHVKLMLHWHKYLNRFGDFMEEWRNSFHKSKWHQLFVCNSGRRKIKNRLHEIASYFRIRYSLKQLRNSLP
jgi:hypothetical protein